MDAVTLLGIILYVILGVLYTVVQIDWWDCHKALPNKLIKILLLMLAIVCLWPWFILVTASKIVMNEL